MHSKTTVNQYYIAKKTPMLGQSWHPESSMAACPKPEFSETLQSLMEPSYPESISSLEDSPAKTFRLQDMERAWKASDRDFSSRLLGSPKNLKPRSSSSKMFQVSQVVDSVGLPKRLPTTAMMRDGCVYQLKKWVPTIRETVGFYWPTPMARQRGVTPLDRIGLVPDTATQGVKKISGKSHSLGLETAIFLFPSVRDPHKTPGRLNPMWVEWLMGFPTEWTALSPSVMQWYLYKRRRRLNI